MQPDSAARSARQQQRRREVREKNQKIAAELTKAEETMQGILKDAAERLDMDVNEFTARFLSQATAYHDAKPSAWNGFVSEMSREWADEKATHPGRQFLDYVVARINREGVYAAMTPEEKEPYIKIAQQARDAKISAGTVATSDGRRVQGSVKKELFAMSDRLEHLHDVTSLEVLFIVVSGSKSDGLLPVYFATDKARVFLESYVKVESEDFISMMVKAVHSGGAAMGRFGQNLTQGCKTEVRTLFLESLRDAATSVASDGSLPKTPKRCDISSMIWKTYLETAQKYHVEVYGWPMEKDGSMKDPSNVGGYTELKGYVTRLKNKTTGFRRLTDSEYDAWVEKQQDELGEKFAESRPRKERADKGQTRKRKPALEPAAAEAARPKSRRPKARNTDAAAPPTAVQPTISESSTATSPVAETQPTPTPTSSSTALGAISASSIPIINSAINQPHELAQPTPNLAALDFAYTDSSSATLPAPYYASSCASPPLPAQYQFQVLADGMDMPASSPQYPLVPVTRPTTVVTPTTPRRVQHDSSSNLGSADSTPTGRGRSISRQRDVFRNLTPDNFTKEGPRRRRDSNISRTASPSPLPGPGAPSFSTTLPPSSTTPMQPSNLGTLMYGWNGQQIDNYGGQYTLHTGSSYWPTSFSGHDTVLTGAASPAPSFDSGFGLSEFALPSDK
ncbi:hypothetical protein FRC08_002386 [Ceratobasidium sp. 394]|nr:hypothetical protein FRC08_002386 [Ceratobasidium sp. 394]